MSKDQEKLDQFMTPLNDFVAIFKIVLLKQIILQYYAIIAMEINNM